MGSVTQPVDSSWVPAQWNTDAMRKEFQALKDSSRTDNKKLQGKGLYWLMRCQFEQSTKEEQEVFFHTIPPTAVLLMFWYSVHEPKETEGDSAFFSAMSGYWCAVEPVCGIRR